MYSEIDANIEAQVQFARELKERRNRRFSVIAGRKIKRLHNIGRGLKNWWGDASDKSLSHKRRLARTNGVESRLFNSELAEYFAR